MTQDWIQIIMFEHGDKSSGSLTEKLRISCLTDSYHLVFFFPSEM